MGACPLLGVSCTRRNLPVNTSAFRQAAALILEVAGERGAVQPPYPALLLEAVEACGRLALVCALAGGILEAYGGEVDAEYVALLKEDNCEVLREGEHGDEHVAIEDRLITNSLRTFKGKDRERAEALFKLMGCFPEDVAVPAAVLDVMAPTLVEEGTKRPKLKVRSTATALLRCGLLRGSIGAGVQMHDIVRHHAITLHSAEELRAKNRLVVERLLASLGGEYARLDAKKHDVPWYLRRHLWWNVRGAISAEMTGNAALDDDLVLALLLRERKGFGASAAVLAIGKERAIAHAEELVTGGRVHEAALWLDAVWTLKDTGLLPIEEEFLVVARLDEPVELHAFVRAPIDLPYPNYKAKNWLIESMEAESLDPLLVVAGVRAFNRLGRMARARSELLPGGSNCVFRALPARVASRVSHPNIFAALCAKYAQLSVRSMAAKPEPEHCLWIETNIAGFGGISETELESLRTAFGGDDSWLWAVKAAIGVTRFLYFGATYRRYFDTDALAPPFFADEAALVELVDHFSDAVARAFDSVTG